jgi:hypothetical protein
MQAQMPEPMPPIVPPESLPTPIPDDDLPPLPVGEPPSDLPPEPAPMQMRGKQGFRARPWLRSPFCFPGPQ